MMPSPDPYSKDFRASHGVAPLTSRIPRLTRRGSWHRGGEFSMGLAHEEEGSANSSRGRDRWSPDRVLRGTQGGSQSRHEAVHGPDGRVGSEASLLHG